MNKPWLVFAGLVFTVLLGVGWLWLARPIVPKNIQRQVSFVIFYPGNHNPARIDRGSIKYNTTDKVLTYTATVGPVLLTVTNQSTPEAFTDIAQTYEKVISSMHPTGSFDSSVGKVNLTRPDHADNQQVAVANSQGTLMFVRADHDLSDDQWRRFFNNLNNAQ